MGELAQDLVMLINRIFPPGTARQLSLSLGAVVALIRGVRCKSIKVEAVYAEAL